MRQIDVPAEVQQLHALADDFAALREVFTTHQPALDSEGLAWLSARITDTQTLARRSLVRLEILQDCQLAALPGHRSALKCLAAVAQDASRASLDLATALVEFPFDTAVSGPPPEIEGDLRQQGHRIAHRAIRTALNQAAHAMDICGAGCRWVATPLARANTAQQTPLASKADTQLKPPAPTGDTAPTLPAPPVKLSQAQQAALAAIAAGGVRMYEVGRNGPMRIHAPAARISIRTYDVLESQKLVGRDTARMLYQGQPIFITPAGRAALPTAPAPSPGPPTTAVPPAPRHR